MSLKRLLMLMLVIVIRKNNYSPQRRKGRREKRMSVIGQKQTLAIADLTAEIYASDVNN